MCARSCGPARRSTIAYTHRDDGPELAKNPNGLVPVIVDDDFVLWESNSIIRYLANKYVAQTLLPPSPRARAEVDRWIDWQATEFNNAWRYAFSALVRKDPAFNDPGQIEASRSQWTKMVAILDSQLAGTGGYVAGNSFTLADIPIGLSVNRWFLTPIDRPRFANVEALLRAAEQASGLPEVRPQRGRVDAELHCHGRPVIDSRSTGSLSGRSGPERSGRHHRASPLARACRQARAFENLWNSESECEMIGNPTPTERLIALWDHLGIGAAHVATQMPGDISGLATGFGSRLAGIVLCVPTRLDPANFSAVSGRVLMISGEGGLTADVTARAMARLAGARRVVLAGYDAPGWADVVADRTDEIAREMTDFLDTQKADVPAHASREGAHAGISYRIEGSGPALVLLPFFLAPSQWAPAVPRLAQTFTVITLGGPHLGGVATLEDRARAPTYQAMFRTLIDLMAPEPGEAILDVGCGAGSLDRLLARRLGAANAITAIDTNPFLLREAALLAKAEGLDGLIRFAPGNAEALPFADESFDCIFSVTVLEECDADRALAEMVRVARPGGRVGVIVRSLDLPQWWSVEVPDAIRRRMTDAAAIRRRQGRRRCQPLSPRPDGRPRGSHLLPLAGNARPARRTDLALSRGPFAVAADIGRNDGVARRARCRRRAGPSFHGASHALRRGTQAGEVRYSLSYSSAKSMEGLYGLYA